MSVTNAPETEAKRRPLRAVPKSLARMYDNRWLIFYFIQRDLSSTYRKSFLGFLWIVLTPLLMIALYSLVFSKIVGIRFREVEGQGVANFGLYLYCGLIPFLAFAGSINQSVKTIKSNSNLVQRVVFPVEILPLSTILTNFITQSSGLIVLVSVVFALERQLHWTLVLLPAIMALQLVFTLGLGYLMSVLGAYLPDLGQVTQATTRAMFFLTPIIWPASLAYSRGYGFVVDYNPIAFIVTSYRDLVLTGELPALEPALWWSGIAIGLLVVGFWLFVRSKKRFADLI